MEASMGSSARAKRAQAHNLPRQSRDESGRARVHRRGHQRRPTRVRRSLLRHRIIVKEGHIGVSDDGAHDRSLIVKKCVFLSLIFVFFSYAMQHFVRDLLKSLKQPRDEGGNSVFETERFRVLVMLSDNASQHFKSSVSMNWLTPSWPLTKLNTSLR